MSSKPLAEVEIRVGGRRIMTARDVTIHAFFAPAPGEVRAVDIKGASINDIHVETKAIPCADACSCTGFIDLVPKDHPEDPDICASCGHPVVEV